MFQIGDKVLILKYFSEYDFEFPEDNSIKIPKILNRKNRDYYSIVGIISDINKATATIVNFDGNHYALSGDLYAEQEGLELLNTAYNNYDNLNKQTVDYLTKAIQELENAKNIINSVDKYKLDDYTFQNDLIDKIVQITDLINKIEVG